MLASCLKHRTLHADSNKIWVTNGNFSHYFRIRCTDPHLKFETLRPHLQLGNTLLVLCSMFWRSVLSFLLCCWHSSCSDCRVMTCCWMLSLFFSAWIVSICAFSASCSALSCSLQCCSDSSASSQSALSPEKDESWLMWKISLKHLWALALTLSLWMQTLPIHSLSHWQYCIFA